MKEMLTSAPKERTAKKVLSHLEIHQAENGGHIVEHHFEHYSHPVESHAFGEDEGAKVLAHIATHMNIKHDMLSKPEAEDETGGNIPEEK